MRCAGAASLALILTSALCQGQSDKSPHFEVVSIKPVSRDVPMVFSGDAGQMSWSRIPLTNLIADAYKVNRDQITGPDWLSTEFYVITAKLPPGSTKDQYPQMMANLLAERFGLVVHRIAKAVSGYELVVAPGGPKLTPSALETATEAPPTSSAPRGFERPMPDANGFPISLPGMTMTEQSDGGMTKMTFRQVTMAFLAGQLRSTLTRSGPGNKVPVTDKTGIGGKFDFHLEIPAPAMRLPPQLRLMMGQDMTTNGDPDVGPQDISAALEKQLGLKLNPVKTKLDYIVVDKANKIPTEN